MESRKPKLLMKILIWLGMITVPSLILFAGTPLFIAPCFPGFLGYFLIEPCQNSSAEWIIFPDWIFRMLVPPVMIWMALIFIVGGAMEILIYSSLHCFCLTNYHFLFWRKCQLNKNLISQTVQIYKELQLLVTYYNVIHGSRLSVLLTVLSSSNFIISAYATVALSEINLLQRLYFRFMTIDLFLVMLFCDGGFKAAVNSVSISILAKVKAAPYFIKGRVMRRYIKSWPSTKIRLGCTNFYDKETPLNLIGFCLGQVVNLLLL